MATYMSLNKFLLTFFPRPSSNERHPSPSEPKPYLCHKDMLPFATVESARDLAVKLAKLVNTSHKDRPAPCPGFKLALSQGSSSNASASDNAVPYVDGALYPSNDAPTDGHLDWGKQRLLIRFTLRTTGGDPFDDSDDDHDVLEQLKSYVAEAFARQQRTALYLLLVHGRAMRLTRWDRSGTIYSEAVDYVQNPHLLRNTLYNFSLLIPEQQGLDPSATLLDPHSPEYHIMDKFARAQDTDIPEHEGPSFHLPSSSKKLPRVFAYVRRMFAASLSDRTWPRYKLLVPSKSKSFLVGKPSFVVPGALTGRATRGYVAIDCETKRFVFLKDTWLPDHENVETEGEVLRKLRRVGVKNVPTLVCDAELQGQETQTQLYWDEPAGSSAVDSRSDYSFGAGSERGSVPRRPRNARSDSFASSLTTASMASARSERSQSLRQTGHFRHYRIVVEEVCMPLSSFKTGRQLVSVIRDCLEAHRGAFTSKYRILHRDIGIGNILILPTLVKLKTGLYTSKWKGVLTDWELAKSVPYIGELPQGRRPARMGTWQSFVSAHSLDNPHLPVQVEDELESFFHVLYYNGLRYLRHNCTDVPAALADYFDPLNLSSTDQWSYPSGSPSGSGCSPAKREAMRTGILRNRQPAPSSPGSSTRDDSDSARTPSHTPSEFYFVDPSTGLPTSHPLNTVFWTALPWFAVRYARLSSRKHGTRARFQFPHAVLAPDERENVLARKLETHEAFGALLGRVLEAGVGWPGDDRVGDQLERARCDPESSLGDGLSASGSESDVAAQPSIWSATERDQNKPEDDSESEPPTKRAKKDGELDGKKPSVLPSIIRGLAISRRSGRAE
ncbi:hypothetical protein BV20DRAFT_795314 [Pilatotrama ljubarskyi]|nr:hypothetical protein BV20DRAFT_795314 [Pilatotrama ljubarskyi]